MDNVKDLEKLNKDKMLRKLLFTPCTDKEHLKLWLNKFLDLDFPDTKICDDDLIDPTNSTALDIIWEVYQKALDGTDENFQNILVYAARNAYKTLSASAIEVLGLFHLKRNVVHMAAIEKQATKCQSYIESCMRRPVLRDFLSSKNKRTITVSWYINLHSGEILTLNEFDALDDIYKNDYLLETYGMEITVCTVAGANGLHSPLFILDELDIAPPGPIEEAKMIPCETIDGKLPITLMISSRKYRFGLVQQEIDKSIEKGGGLVTRHWNIFDVAKPCPKTRNLSDLPKIKIYYSRDTLECKSQNDYDSLIDEEKSKYICAEGYEGCLSKCKMFAGCLGRLATKQTSTNKLLQSVSSIAGTWSKLSSVDTVKCQLLCWKPLSSGLIYPYFDVNKHVISAYDMASKIDICSCSNLSKKELIDIFIKREFKFFMGMDFGFTHKFSVVFGASDGFRLFVIDVLSVKGLEVNEKIELSKKKYFKYRPLVFADPASPSDILSFRRAGFRMKNFTKDVIAGIDAVRGKLNPAGKDEPEIFFLANDPGVYILIKEMLQYHWALDSDGNPTDEPDKENDDNCDALRYLCQNLFAKPKQNKNAKPNVGKTVVNMENNWLSEKIRELATDITDEPLTESNGSGIILKI